MNNHEDYAHIRDAQSERTKWELWAIVAIVVIVVAGGVVWRAATAHPGKPEMDGPRSTAVSNGVSGAGSATLPAAAAYNLPH